MANIHILTRTGSQYTVLFHIAVPAGNNSAGVAWSTAVLNSGYSSGKSALPLGNGSNGTISSADNTAIAGGTLLERAYSIDPTQGNPSATLTQQAANLDAAYAQAVSDVQAEAAYRLDQFGRTLT